MHPGANVGMDLILWMGLATTATLLLFSAMENMRYSDYSSYNYTYVNGVLVPDSNCSPYFSCAAQDAYMAQIKRLVRDSALVLRLYDQETDGRCAGE